MSEIFSEFLLSHGAELLGISDSIFNLFNLFEDFVFICRKSIFTSIESIANTIHLCEDV